jgi:hypothetical protein
VGHRSGLLVQGELGWERMRFCASCTLVYVFSVVGLQQIGCMNVIGWFPCVIAFGVSLPFDKILQGATAPEVVVIPNGLHLVLHFSFYKVQWWLGEVWAMLCHFVIWQ